MLPNSFYVDQAIFEKEKQKIFLNGWVFFCFLEEVSEESSYLRKTMLGEDIFIYRQQGELYGYYNSCPHRFHPIVKGSKGKLAHLTCGYHRWSFRADGKVSNIPFCHEAYQFGSSRIENISLDRFEVKVVGKFVFVNLSKKPKKIEKQFSSELLRVLEEISQHIAEVHTVTLEKKFNWKLIQENLRDPLHPAFVHPKTLAKSIDSGIPGIPRYLPFFALPLRKASYGGPDVNLTKESAYRKNFTRPWPCENKYYNYWIYPNLHLAAPDGGLTFVFENFVPVSPQETQVEIHYLIGEHNFSSSGYKEFLGVLTQNAMKVYNEDFDILESIQAVAGSSLVRFPVNGKFERMITRFHKVYLNQTQLWIRRLVLKLVAR